jgi:hypothetical protein
LDGSDLQFLNNAARKLQEQGVIIATEQAHLGSMRASVRKDTYRTIEYLLQRLAERFSRESDTSDRPDLKVLEILGGKHENTTGINRGWASMEMVNPPLTESIKRHAKLRPKKRYGFIGGFKQPMRALIPAFDGRAWQLKLKKEGGSILLDMSGSMSLNDSDILDMLKRAPYATILGYSEDDTGKLYVLARNGRYVKTIPPHGAGNGCDGPALRYLASLPGPRIWVSDGQVVGNSGCQHPQLFEECTKICKESNILRINSIPCLLASK